MRLEARKYLYDILQAADRIIRFTDGKSYDEYAGDEMLSSAVERQFEIIGEALGKLVRTDTEIGSRIPEWRRIVAFRNILVHAYTDIDHRIVWDIIQTWLGTLREKVKEILETPD